MGTSSYTQSIAGCLDGAIGKHGLSNAELARWLDPLGRAIVALQDDYKARRLPHLRVPEETADLAAAEAALARLSQGADTIVFFGIGGSSLGGSRRASACSSPVSATACSIKRLRRRSA